MKKLKTIILAALYASLVTSLAAGAEPLSGKQLYGEYCARCHSPLEKTRKPNRPASRIRSAIEYYHPSVRNLTDLTPAQIQAIADALTNNG